MNQEKQQFWTVDITLLTICIVLGTVLRIGNPLDLSFINDELSTLTRINYDTVWGVINYVKQTDSHPAGLYVFLYYWTAIFGTSEFAFKLPFILMSIASMFLVYRIATIWFSQTVGLLVLAFFCTLQYPIWWSTIARQYQSGLFCTLLMAYCGSKILIEKNDEKKYWIGFILMGAASMYNHYFSFIFAALIGVSGFAWMRKEILLKYIGAGVSIILLFAPHISITQYHLVNSKGHEWYGPPTPSFLKNHLLYIFHYSILSWGLVLLLLLGSIIMYGKTTIKEKNKARFIALLWFLFPLLFGYFYSIYKAPILRESHLLFSFPYLLFFLLSYFPNNLPDKAKISIVALILLVNTSTLIFVRKHFQTMNTHPYEHFIVLSKEFLEEYPQEKTNIILGENPLYLQYYKDAYGANFEHTSNFKPTLSFMDFRIILQESEKTHLIVGNLPEAHIQMAMDYYPYLYKKSYGINYEYYILSKDKALQDDSLEIDFKTELSFDYAKSSDGWSLERNNVFQNSQGGNFYYHMPHTVEWGPTFQMETSKITPRDNEFLDIALDIKAIDSIIIQPKGILVLEILNQQDSVIAWKAVDVEAQTVPSKDWQRVYLSIRFAHEAFYFEVKNTKIKIFFWNKEKQAIHLDRFRIQSHKGNPILYGDTNDLKI